MCVSLALSLSLSIYLSLSLSISYSLSLSLARALYLSHEDKLRTMKVVRQFALFMTELAPNVKCVLWGGALIGLR